MEVFRQRYSSNKDESNTLVSWPIQKQMFYLYKYTQHLETRKQKEIKVDLINILDKYLMRFTHLGKLSVELKWEEKYAYFNKIKY